jgi:hypothetical protein
LWFGADILNNRSEKTPACAKRRQAKKPADYDYLD